MNSILWILHLLSETTVTTWCLQLSQEGCLWFKATVCKVHVDGGSGGWGGIWPIRRKEQNWWLCKMDNLKIIWCTVKCVVSIGPILLRRKHQVMPEGPDIVFLSSKGTECLQYVFWIVEPHHFIDHFLDVFRYYYLKWQKILFFKS